MELIPTTSAEKNAYVLQKVIGLANAWYGESEVRLPESIMALSNNDAIVRGVVRSLRENCCALLCKLEALSYGIV